MIDCSSSITLAPSGSPKGLTVDTITSDSITVSWQSVDSVTGFGVVYNEGFQQVTDGTSVATINGLTRGQLYDISVFSYIDLGSSPVTLSILLDGMHISS